MCGTGEDSVIKKNPVNLKLVNIRAGKSLRLEMLGKRAKRSEKSGRLSCTQKGNKKNVLGGLNLREKWNDFERGTDRVLEEKGIEKSKKTE